MLQCIVSRLLGVCPACKPYLQKVLDKCKNNSKLMFMVVNSGARSMIKAAIRWEAKNPIYTFLLYFNNGPDIGERLALR